MFAREIMSHPAVTMHTRTSLADAAKVLSTMGFTALPVLDDDDRLVGIVSEADLLRMPLPRDPRRHPQPAGMSHRAPPMTVAEVMTTSVESLTPGADVADAARIMVDEGIRCLPIVDGAQVVGVITRRDLLRTALARDDAALLADVLTRLDTFDDPGRFSVTVQAAVADIEDFRDNTNDRETARRLVAAVPGVVHVEVHHQTPDPF